MRTWRAAAGLALIWSGVVLWRERQRRRRSRELLLVVRGAAASRATLSSVGPATVDDGWVDLPTGSACPEGSAGSAGSAGSVGSVGSVGPEFDASDVAVEAIDAVDEMLALLARAETPRPAVTLRLRWRDTVDGDAADGDASVPVVRQVRRNPTAAGTP